MMSIFRSTTFGIITLLVFSGSFVAGQTGQAVNYPQWAERESQGGMDLAQDYVHPDYGGQFSNACRAYVPLTESLGTRKFIAAWTPLSGVVAFPNGEGFAAAGHGWDTSFDGVLWLQVEGLGTTYPTTLIGIGWDATAKKSIPFKLTVTASGPTTQVPFAIASPAGQIWARIGAVGSAVYVYDVQSHTVKKIVDTNADGTVDALAPNFSVTIPLTTIGTGARKEDVLDLNSFRSFVLLPNVDPSIEVMLRHSGLFDLRWAGIMSDGQGGGTLMRLGPPIQKVPVRHVLVPGLLATGQSRLLVRGTPGETIRIMRQKDSQPPVAISGNWTLPKSGRAIVDLTASLDLSWKIRAEFVDDGPVASVWKSIRAPRQPLIFPPTEMRTHEGDSLTLVTDGFQSAHEPVFRHGGVLIAAPSWRMATDGTMKIEVPDIGSTGIGLPRIAVATVELWVRDKVTGKLKTVLPIRLWVHHN